MNLSKFRIFHGVRESIGPERDPLGPKNSWKSIKKTLWMKLYSVFIKTVEIPKKVLFLHAISKQITILGKIY